MRKLRRSVAKYRMRHMGNLFRKDSDGRSKFSKYWRDYV